MVIVAVVLAITVIFAGFLVWKFSPLFAPNLGEKTYTSVINDPGAWPKDEYANGIDDAYAVPGRLVAVNDAAIVTYIAPTFDNPVGEVIAFDPTTLKKMYTMRGAECGTQINSVDGATVHCLLREKDGDQLVTRLVELDVASRSVKTVYDYGTEMVLGVNVFEAEGGSLTGLVLRVPDSTSQSVDLAVEKFDIASESVIFSTPLGQMTPTTDVPTCMRVDAVYACFEDRSYDSSRAPFVTLDAETGTEYLRNPTPETTGEVSIVAFVEGYVFRESALTPNNDKLHLYDWKTGEDLGVQDFEFALVPAPKVTGEELGTSRNIFSVDVLNDAQRAGISPQAMDPEGKIAVTRDYKTDTFTLTATGTKIKGSFGDDLYAVTRSGTGLIKEGEFSLPGAVYDSSGNEVESNISDRFVNLGATPTLLVFNAAHNGYIVSTGISPERGTVTYVLIPKSS